MKQILIIGLGAILISFFVSNYVSPKELGNAEAGLYVGGLDAGCACLSGEYDHFVCSNYSNCSGGELDRCKIGQGGNCKNESAIPCKGGANCIWDGKHTQSCN